MTQDRFTEIREGDEAELSRCITTEDVESFVRLTGDDNPVHVDGTFVANTTLRKPVVHGMLTASFLSTVIGTKLPGQGSLWYEQQLRFLAPVRVGERIRVWVRVKRKSEAQRILSLETRVLGEDGRAVIEGEVKVKMLKQESQEAAVVAPVGEKKGGVIVSGGGRGIGAATARELASQGYGVLVNYSRSEVEAKALVEAICRGGGRAIAMPGDVADREQAAALVKAAAREFAPLAGLVHNASPPIALKSFAELEWADVQMHLDVQIRGAFNLCQEVLPALLQQERGVIVLIASTAADNLPSEKMLPYNLAKAALVSFGRSLAVELGPKGIRVNMVSPGMTQTDLIAGFPEKSKLTTKMHTPLRRLALPEDIAGAVGFLFSDKARHITGETIRVCGGAVMV